MISRIHLGLPNAYKLMCFDRNINENRDVKLLGCDYLLVERCVKLTLAIFVSLSLVRENLRGLSENLKYKIRTSDGRGG